MKFARKRLLCAASAMALLMALLSPAFADVPTRPTTHAPATDPKKETLITAQQMTSNQTTGIVTAIGQVEIARADYILHADKVTYNQKTGVMHAEGHVALLLPSGEVEFADQEEVTGDMRQAFAENIGIIFPDNSRLAAHTSQRYDGRYMTADKAMYTSCNICKDDPNNPPLWQLRGETVTHDNVEHDIYYHDATIDFAGIPVFYTPYLSTPDPTVDRRQGFLTPTAGLTPNLGGYVHLPYYFDIAPDKDATLAPTFSIKDKAQIAGEYRQRLNQGGMQLNGSFTRADLLNDQGIDQGQQLRGHFFGHFIDDINNVWRAGSDVQLSSDKSYLQRYNISSADQLTSRAYIEGFRGRNYAVINSYYFEDLRPSPEAAQPFILPEATFSALGEPGQTFGGRWSLDGGTLITARQNASADLPQQGPNTRRLSLNAGWERPFVSNTGFLTTVSGLIRGDAYWADNVVDPNQSGTVYNNVLLARQFEQANVVTRYPLDRQGDGYQQIIEPIVALTAAPNVKLSAKQPIEDSLDTEFDETNLFSPNRFTGTDLIEGGSRATYGLRQSLIADNGASLNIFGGQSYDIAKNTDFPALSGLTNHSSDYVGRIDLAPGDWFNANYGFRLDHTTLAPQRQDATMSFGVPLFRPNARYISAYETDSATGLIDQVQEITLGFSSHFYKYWDFSLSHIQAFAPQPGPRSSAVSLNYVDECFIAGVTLNQNDTNRADITSGTSIVFHFYLRNLGGIHTDSAMPLHFQDDAREY